MKKFKQAVCMFLAVALVLPLAACAGNGDMIMPAFLIKGEEVTSDEWKKAFDFSDVSDFSIYRSFSMVDGDESIEGEYTYKFNEDKLYGLIEYTECDGEEEPKTVRQEMYVYVDREDNDKQYVYEYDEESGEWTRRRATSDEFQSGSSVLQSMLSSVKFDYSPEKYNEYKKGYVSTSSGSVKTYETVIKIVDGKFAAVVYRAFYTPSEDGEDDDEDREEFYGIDTMQIYAVGSTTIYLPKEYVEK